jgi:hypothetical protein
VKLLWQHVQLPKLNQMAIIVYKWKYYLYDNKCWFNINIFKAS